MSAMFGVMPALVAEDVDGRDKRAFTSVFDGLCPAMTWRGHPHNCLLAIAAPSLSALNFAHTIDGWISFEPANVAKPQSEPAITFSRPTTFAYRPIRSATSSGCSTRMVECEITPGIRTASFGNFAPSQTFHSCSWRGLAASNE